MFHFILSSLISSCDYSALLLKIIKSSVSKKKYMSSLLKMYETKTPVVHGWFSKHLTRPPHLSRNWAPHPNSVTAVSYQTTQAPTCLYPPPPPFFLSPVPTWAIGAIVVVVLALIACMGFCIYKKCVNKGKKPKKVRERKGGRGRRKKDKEGEEGDDKKVKKDINRFCLVYSWVITTG